MSSKTYLDILSNPPEPVPAPPPFWPCEFRSGDGFGIPEGLPPLWLWQSWLPAPTRLRENAFALIWRSQSFLEVAAFMHDSDVHSSAVGKNDRTWEKGDVLELFFQPAGGKQYFEIHITPNLAKLELSIPDSERLRDFKFEDLANCDLGTVGNSSSLPPPMPGWLGHMKIPFSKIGIPENPRRELGRFSVCRYNYNRPWGKEPECSSTSALTKFSFHRPGEWQILATKD